MKTLPLPNISEIARLVRNVRSQIDAECRAFEFDETPGIQLTVGASLNGSWSYQTGDNSFSGGAYSHPAWGVVGVYRDSNSFDVARDIVDQIGEALSYAFEQQQESAAKAEARSLMSAGLHPSQTV